MLESCYFSHNSFKKVLGIFFGGRGGFIKNQFEEVNI